MIISLYNTKRPIWAKFKRFSPFSFKCLKNWDWNWQDIWSLRTYLITNSPIEVGFTSDAFVPDPRQISIINKEIPELIVSDIGISLPYLRYVSVKFPGSKRLVILPISSDTNHSQVRLVVYSVLNDFKELSMTVCEQI